MTEQIYSRIDLAKEQLEVALSLFFDHASYASSITLAGAAEEIFGKALIHQGKEAVLDWKLKEMNVVHSLLHRKDIIRKEFFAEENKIRNMLKHFDSNDDDSFTADLEEAACWILVRACENASKLDIELDRFQDLDDWFYANIVGV
ncbi:MAG: hypothetical protein GKR94_07045 [Gammaproteobacteria bacterium]|nr:hypothetical protein [Gammaproteobacteria bacterium]